MRKRERGKARSEGVGGGAYLQQPIASAMEGRDDGGVDVAAIQTLERGEEQIVGEGGKERRGDRGRKGGGGE